MVAVSLSERDQDIAVVGLTGRVRLYYEDNGSPRKTRQEGI